MTKDQEYDQKGSHVIAVLGVVLILLVVSFIFVVRKFTVTKLIEETPIKKQVTLEDGMFTGVSVGGVVISAEIAKSNDKKAEGLSNMKNLEEGKGMLFIFGSSGLYPFWNKDTFIPLDILWIENEKVVYIGELPAFSGGETAVAASDKKANFVLEVNAGFVKKHNIKIGDSFIINK